MSEKILALDIGGSKTHILLLDTEGNTVFETVAAGVASAFDSTAPLPALENALSILENKDSVVCAAINLGGKNTEQVSNSFRRIFPNIPMKIFRESEGTAAYALGDEYGASIILMAGTGAIAVGKSNEKFVTVGGWGNNIGDDGSGYDIGLQAIRESLKELDGSEPLSPLAQFICGCTLPLEPSADPAFFKDMRDSVRARIAPLERAHIASYAKSVYNFAEKGDPVAQKILDKAGDNLADLIINSAKKLGTATPTVVVTGGLVNSKKFWSPSFESKLTGFKIHYVKDGLIYGTRRIAKEMYKNEK